MAFIPPMTALWSEADSLNSLSSKLKIIAAIVIVIKKVGWYGSHWHCLQIFCLSILQAHSSRTMLIASLRLAM